MNKRTLTKYPFSMRGNIKISMNIYSNLKKSTKERMFKIYAITNKVLKSVTTINANI